MSVPVPIQIRAFRLFTPLYENIEGYVDDFTYRSVVPGGFASASLVLRQPTTRYQIDETIAQGIAAGNSSTPNYIVIPDAQATPINIGDRAWVYSGTGIDASISDSFTRSVSNSWGTATSGQTWANSGGPNSAFSATGSVGRVAISTVNLRHFTEISSGIADCIITGSFTVSATATGASIAASVVARKQDDNNFYMAQFLHDTAGTIDVEITKRNTGTFTTLNSKSNYLAYTPGTMVNFKFYCIGSELGVKVWAATDSEPSIYLITAVDTDFTSGKIGTHSNLVTGNTNTLPVNVDYDNLVMTNQNVKGAIKFGGKRLRVIDKQSAFGFTNVIFNRSLGNTFTNDVIIVTRPGRVLTSLPVVSDLANMFNRIQFVDKRNQEVVWEGRIEEPARKSDELNVWNLDCLGSMVAATDIQRPMWYIDSGAENWHLDNEANQQTTYWDCSVSDDVGVTCKIAWKDGSTSGGSDSEPQVNSNAAASETEGFYNMFSWELARSTYTYIGRFRVKIKGQDDMNPTGSNTDTDGALRAAVVFRNDNYDPTVPTDYKLFNYSQSEFQDILGSDLTEQHAMTVVLGQSTRGGGNVNDRFVTTGGHNIGVAFTSMVVQVQRKDRNGIGLVLSSHYNHGNYVTVPMIVEDVVGRFLVKGWDLIFDNAPLPGSVRAREAYIDSSSTTQITQAVFKDATTAADILNFCMGYQTNAYWAIWESDGGADTYPGPMGGNDYDFLQFRFEWATWPNSWGYYITEFDELAEQPSGEDLYNFVFLTYRYNQLFRRTVGGTLFAVADSVVDRMHISWGEGIDSRALTRGGFTRSAAWRDENINNDTTANNTADQFRRDHANKTNSGTITVSRPVYFYDAGSNSYSGCARTIDPWAIRPGKLVRVPTMIGESGALSHEFGVTAPLSTIDAGLYKGVAVEYNSANNQAVIELDRPANWNLPAQVAR